MCVCVCVCLFLCVYVLMLQMHICENKLVSPPSSKTLSAVIRANSVLFLSREIILTTS